MSTSPLPPDMVACEQCGKPEHKTKLKKKRFCSPTCARQAKASLGHDQPSSQTLQQQHVDNNTTQATGQNTLNMNNINDTVAANVNALNNSMSMEVGHSLVTAAPPMVPVNVGMVDTTPLVAAMPMVAAPTLAPTPVQLPMPAPLMNDVVQPSTAQIAAIPTAAAATMPAMTTQPPPAVDQQPQMANWTVADVCEFIKNLPGCTDYVDDFEQQEIDGQALLLLKENHLVNAMGMKLGPALKIVAKVESMKEVSAAALNAANNAANNMDTMQ